MSTDIMAVLEQNTHFTVGPCYSDAAKRRHLIMRHYNLTSSRLQAAQPKLSNVLTAGTFRRPNSLRSYPPAETRHPELTEPFTAR